jgi:oligopeptide/dipeptide ABC transporter ATP-binding protein
MLLKVENLHAEFTPKSAPKTLAVRGLSFEIAQGEMLGMVGESGCGKSVTALSIMRLLDPPGRISAGSVLFDGIDLTKLTEAQMRDIRGKRIAFIFQDPMTALNPVLTIGTHLIETLRAHATLTGREARAQALEWLAKVHIPDPEHRMGQYPYELSGGMRQRVMIAMAFALRPDLIIADEPTTALDVTVQAQVLGLMDEMRLALGTAVLLITHDLGVVGERCDRVVVMYAGRIVERATPRELFDSPKHPYTQGLLESLPDLSKPVENGPLPALAGQPPRLIDGMIPSGCLFAPRCARRVETLCDEIDPPETDLGDGRSVRCVLYDPGAATKPDRAALKSTE